MRTTIELPDAQRARLLELAARRNEKGFSSIVQEAIAEYLEREGNKGERIQAALAVRGSFAGAEGEHLQEAASEARQGWR